VGARVGVGAARARTRRRWGRRRPPGARGAKAAAGGAFHGDFTHVIADGQPFVNATNGGNSAKISIFSRNGGPAGRTLTLSSLFFSLGAAHLSCLGLSGAFGAESFSGEGAIPQARDVATVDRSFTATDTSRSSIELSVTSVRFFLGSSLTALPTLLCRSGGVCGRRDVVLTRTVPHFHRRPLQHISRK
jgi:hypothetical protein